jgi:ankyrin repeat protein
MHGKLSIVEMLLYKFPVLSTIGFLEEFVNDPSRPIWAMDFTSVAQHAFSQLNRRGHFIECEDNERNKPIMLAAKKRNYDIACLLICYGADVKCLSYDHGQKVLSWAIGNCHCNAIEVLISGGFLGIEQFHAISSYECLSKLKELPDSLSGPLASKILTFAITNNIYKVILKNFIANNFAIDGFLDTNPPITALMWAAQKDDTELLKLLILQGVQLNVNLYNSTGRTALHYAAENDHVQCGILLTDAGARVDEILEPRSTSKISIRCSEKFKEAIKRTSLFQSKKNVCVIGNACSGKSTLIKSLQDENASYWTQWCH